MTALSTPAIGPLEATHVISFVWSTKQLYVWALAVSLPLDRHRPHAVVLELETLKDERRQALDLLVTRIYYAGLLLQRELPRNLR